MRERESFALPRAAEAGTEVFVIGDVHGRADLLEALLDAAAREPKRAARRELVFLGDLVDRGPRNLATIALACQAGEHIGAERVHRLMGNHEMMMRMALDARRPPRQAMEAYQTWLANGGGRVLAEFAPGLEAIDYPPTALKIARSAAPQFVLDWLESLVAHARSGDLLFVHAGVNPSVELEPFLQLPWDAPLATLRESGHWAWVRGSFLAARPDARGFSGLFVVHGHSPADLNHTAGHGEQIARFRLNLDAGSGRTGRLKLAIIRGADVDVLTVSGPTDREL